MSIDRKRSDEAETSPTQAEPPAAPALPIPPSTAPNSNTDFSKDSHASINTPSTSIGQVSSPQSELCQLELVSSWPKAYVLLLKATEREVGLILSKLYLDGHGLHQMHWWVTLQDTMYPRSSNQASTGNKSIRHSAKPLTVDRYPPGYGKVAAFEDCDPSFLIFRKFGWLHSRVLLHLQDEVQELEEALESLDDWEFSSGDPSRLKNRRIDYGRSKAPRKDLLLEIGAKLAEYGETRALRL